MHHAVRTLLTALFALLLGAATVHAQPAPAEAPAPTSTPPASTPLVSDPEYKLGQGDVVDVLVIGSPDFNTRARVSADGAVILPLIGAVKAEGSTPSQFASTVGDLLKKGGFFANPVVRVELAGIRSRYVTVLGFVGSPGLMPLDRAYRLSEIMARVGGKTGGGASYVLVTPQDGPPKKYSISGLATGAEDPLLNAGDKIFVPSAEEEVFYMSGEVKAPGAMPATADLTVRVAIARAGGLSENGSEKKVTIVRGGKKLPKATADTKVEPGDIVTVGARLF